MEQLLIILCEGGMILSRMNMIISEMHLPVSSFVESMTE